MGAAAEVVQPAAVVPATSTDAALAAKPPVPQAAPPVATPVTDTAKKPDTAPVTPTPVAAPPVVKYDLKAPAGSLLTPEAVQGIEAFASKHGLTPEQAKAVLEREDDTAETKAAKVQEQLAARATAQKAALLADAEIGGDKLPEAMETAKRGMVKIASPTLRKWLDETGLGDDVEVVKMFRKVGNMFKDDKLVVAGAAQTSKPKTLEEMFYPKTAAQKAEAGA
jgi:hypothetical protein